MLLYFGVFIVVVCVVGLVKVILEMDNMVIEIRICVFIELFLNLFLNFGSFCWRGLADCLVV